MGRSSKASALNMIQKKMKKSFCLGLFLRAIEEVFDSSKIKYNKDAFRCTKKKIANSGFTEIRPNLCCENGFCFDLAGLRFFKIEELNKFVLNKEFSLFLSQEIIKEQLRSYDIVDTGFEGLNEWFPNIDLGSSLEQKIISRIKKQLSMIKPLQIGEGKFSVGNYFKVDFKITTKVIAIREDDRIVNVSNISKRSFTHKKSKKISVLDKACFSLMIISDYVERILDFNDHCNVNNIKGKNGFILLLIKILDKYSEFLVNAEEVNKDEILKAGSYLDGSGKNIVAIQNRLNFFLNHKNKKALSGFRKMLEDPDQLKQLKLELRG